MVVFVVQTKDAFGNITQYHAKAGIFNVSINPLDDQDKRWACKVIAIENAKLTKGWANYSLKMSMSNRSN